MILITGATGHLGTAVVENLLKKIKPEEIAIYARDENKASHWKVKGVSVRIGDFRDTVALKKALAGITKVLLIPINDEDAFDQHKNVVDAAQAAQVSHFYYAGGAINHNVEQSKLGFLKDAYFHTENYIRETGLTYTICQNGLYADTLPFFIGEELPVNGVVFPSGAGKASFALRAELGEAIANIILLETTINASYTLAGNHAYSFSEIAKILSNLSGKEILFNSPDPEEYAAQLKGYGVPEGDIYFASLFGELIKNQEYAISDGTLAQVLGRKPTSLQEYLKQTYFAEN